MRRRVGVERERLGVAADGGERRAQFVGDVGQQLPAGAVGLDERGLALCRLVGHAVEGACHLRHLVAPVHGRPRQPVAGGESAGGVFQVAQPRVRRAEHCHRRDDGTRQQQADGAGDQPRHEFPGHRADRAATRHEHDARDAPAGGAQRRHRPRRSATRAGATSRGPARRRHPAADPGRPRREVGVAGRQTLADRTHQRRRRRHVAGDDATVGEHQRDRTSQLAEPGVGQRGQIGPGRAIEVGREFFGNQRGEITEQARRQHFVARRRQPQQQAALDGEHQRQHGDEADGDPPVQAAEPATWAGGVRHRRTCSRHPTPSARATASRCRSRSACEAASRACRPSAA